MMDEEQTYQVDHPFIFVVHVKAETLFLGRAVNFAKLKLK